MPLYEYYCQDCDKEFEALRSHSQADDPAPCPRCGKESPRLLSTFSFKSSTFTAPKLGPSKGRVLKPRRQAEAPQEGRQTAG